MVEPHHCPPGYADRLTGGYWQKLNGPGRYPEIHLDIGWYMALLSTGSLKQWANTELPIVENILYA